QNEAEWKGYVYACAFFVVSVTGSVFYHQHFHISMTLGMRIRSALMSAVYSKALTISNEARKDSTVGEIVNLMSVDCQRMQDVTGYLYAVWSSPLNIALALWLLWGQLGASVLAGLGIMILLIPLNAILTVKLRKLQAQQMKLKDDRVKLMNEVLSGIKVLKLYAWESSFQEKVSEIRHQELTVLKKSAYIQAVTLVTFVTYVLTSESHYLDAGKAFVSLSLFNILRAPINLLPMIIAYLAQAQVSLSRLGNFLRRHDLDTNNVQRDSHAESAVSIQKGTFTWDKQLHLPTLRGIDLEVPKGKLVAVVGQVGSGKSSLVSAILGEMEKLEGKVTVQSSVAYVPQQAWIQNAPLKDNVLFGSPYRSRDYNAVLDACALRADLDILPGGDMTEIGEKGINLSGGQKQRVSLARAVYSDADIYLLDDPLSAVDSHVGKHIFQEVIGAKGILRHKTRVLVTHGVHWLPMVDMIVVMTDGRISEMGSYDQLLIQTLKAQMLQRVDSVTSDHSLTSGDELPSRTRCRTRSDSQSTLERSMKGEKPAKPIQAPKDKLIEEEKSETGKVKLSVFLTYFRAIGLGVTLVIFALYAAYQGVSVYSSIWLSQWTDDDLLANTSLANTTQYEERNYMYLGVYGGLGVGQALLVLVYSLLSTVSMVKAAGTLHVNMLSNIMRSPMSFFDTTPSGRIVNRFSSDVTTVDNNLPMMLRQGISTVLSVISTLVVISYSTPIFLVVVLPLGVLYYLVQRFYIPTSRQLKRIESTTRSPIFNHFSETITGAASIRAWLGFRLEFLGNLVVLTAAMFAVISPDVEGGVVGLSVSYAMQVTGALNWMVRAASDLETNIVSVERIKEYTDTPTEAPWSLPGRRPPGDWPDTGTVNFLNYSTRYRPGLDLVLKGLNCHIQGGQKVGIVGRTGAGKSSMTVALFRLIESAGGSIVIDGQQISKMGLHDLRARLTILPQDPVLFSGSLRMNLDPFDQYTDEQIWRALEHAHLKKFVTETPAGLGYECGEEGANLSVGQRQLVCLARSLLRKTKILVLDEATAAVDMETDDLIQQTIRTEFKDCTVLTIAHRLNTILDYDRILVMDQGEVREYDSPETLLQNKQSAFYSMAKDANLNRSLLLDNTWPEFTECFQKSVLVWVPCGWLWLLLPVYTCYLSHLLGGAPLSVNILNTIKSCVSVLLAVLGVVEMTLSVTDEHHAATVVYVSGTVKVATFILACVLVQVERRKAIITSGVLWIFWLLLTLAGIIPFYTKIIHKDYRDDLTQFCVYYVYYSLVLLQLLLHSVADTRSLPGYHVLGQKPSPELTASFPSRLTFWWMNGLVLRAYRKDLVEDDLYDLHPRDNSARVVPQFRIAWKKELHRVNRLNREREKTASRHRHYVSFTNSPTPTRHTRDDDNASETTSLLANGATISKGSIEDKGSKPKQVEASLLRVLVRTYGWDLMTSFVLKLVCDLLQFVGPLLLDTLIAYTNNKQNEAEWKGYVYACSFFVVSMTTCVIYRQHFHMVMTLGMRIRSALITAVYTKALTISNEERKHTTVGHVVNLMSTDCRRLDNATEYLYVVWSAPLNIALALWLLWGQLGASVLAGLGIMILLIPLNAILTVKLRKLQAQQMKLKDDRVKLMNEVLTGIKVLKLYAWEPSFQEKVSEIRHQELMVLRKNAYVLAVSNFLWTTAPFIVTLVTFVTYVLASESHYLDAGKAFVSLSLFYILRAPMNLLPVLVAQLAQAQVSLSRLGNFLRRHDLDTDNVQRDSHAASAVSIVRGTFTWDKKLPLPTLRGIDLEVPKGKLVAVVGQVGSGKSSLVSAILGEMEKLEGKVTVQSSVAYVPQQAWIQNTTLKDNVLFGSPYRPRDYNAVLDACALRPDLDVLPGGDMTEIGEKGINLSGGQKQRVSLARAVYSDADIYLLDDPLSAVDSHVGKHIFQEVIGAKGMLCHKTRVLVTHGVHWLPMVDMIVVMTDGRISEMGSYDQLLIHTTKVHIQQQMDSGTSVDELPSRSVKLSVFLTYFRAIGLGVTLVIFALYAAYQGVSVYSSIWLSQWTDDDLLANTSLANTTQYEERNYMYLGVYGGLGVGQAMLMLVYSLLSTVSMVKAAGTLHVNMLSNIMRSPMSFFDTTPSGRIVNRFSSDVTTVDNNLPVMLRQLISTVLSVISTLVVISYSTPIFLVVVLPLGGIYYLVQRFYIPTSRQLKRIESTTRSPIFNHFSETITGAASIRAYSAQSRFIDDNMAKVDKNLTFCFFSLAANRWQGFRLEFLGNLVVLLAAMFAVVSDVEGGVVGLSVTYAMQVTVAMNWMVRAASDLETNIAPWSLPGRRPPDDWPDTGTVNFLNYSTRYRPGLDLVLKGLNCHIQGGQKVGIVGRTGAGKSSMTVALFRLIESAGGSIVIDGQQISKMGLHDLRARLTILPQDPVLFSGSLRMNLDPFDQYTDEQIWRAVEHAHLKKFVTETPAGLGYECGEGGANLSVGQRQLVCLARSLLRKSKILVLDEATAAVDMETDDLIQQTIRTEFKDCTVFTIAHRLNTILDYDRILVMDQGEVREYDSPETLLQNKQSAFYNMAKDANLV
ncbi:hypothetical protein BaRGS_00020764, partial [Batillaria attramentaria]